jgi:hypothetical protein
MVKRISKILFVTQIWTSLFTHNQPTTIVMFTNSSPWAFKVDLLENNMQAAEPKIKKKIQAKEKKMAMLGRQKEKEVRQVHKEAVEAKALVKAENIQLVNNKFKEINLEAQKVMAHVKAPIIAKEEKLAEEILDLQVGLAVDKAYLEGFKLGCKMAKDV